MSQLQPHFLPYALGRIRQSGTISLVVNGLSISYRLDTATRGVNLTDNVRACGEAKMRFFRGMWIFFPDDEKAGVVLC